MLASTVSYIKFYKIPTQNNQLLFENTRRRLGNVSGAPVPFSYISDVSACT